MYDCIIQLSEGFQDQATDGIMRRDHMSFMGEEAPSHVPTIRGKTLH